MFCWPLRGRASFVGPYCWLCFVSIVLSCLLVTVLWSPAGKGMTSLLSCRWCFVAFPYGVLDQVCYLIVSVLDLCRLPDFDSSRELSANSCSLLAMTLTSQIRFLSNQSTCVWSCYVQWFRRRCIYKKVHYFTFDLDLRSRTKTKRCPVSSTSYDLCICKVWSSYVQRFRRNAFTRNIWFDLDPR